MPLTEEQILKQFETGPLSSSDRKVIIDYLLERVQRDKPQITSPAFRHWVKSIFPYWADKRCEDIGSSLYFMVLKLPNIKRSDVTDHGGVPRSGEYKPDS